MKQIIIALVVLSMTSHSFAQTSCPLTNVKLTDLRTAASKLSKTILLSAECKSFENTVNQANANLANVANKIADADTTPEANQEEKKATALQAIGQLNTISTLFSDQRCGGEIMGFLDYASVFVDVATNMTPYLALNGGEAAMPWVLGAAIGGAAAKALIMFFQNKSVNMRNPDQSNSFLKNSCSFYNLNMIKNSLDELELRQAPSIVNELIVTREKLKTHMANAHKEPSSELAKKIKLVEKDLAKIKGLQEQIKVDVVEACSYIRSYANGEDTRTSSVPMIERTWENYQDTLEKDTFQYDMEEKYFKAELNPLVIAKPENPNCSRWLTKMNSMIDVGLAKLKKSSEADSDLKGYQTWVARKVALEEEIKVQEAKIKFFNEVTSSGFNIEYSEIIRSHRQVQDSIFDSYRWLKTLKMKGLAEAWLRVKYDDAKLDLKNFQSRFVEVNKSIAKIEKTIGKPMTRESIAEFNSNYTKENNGEHPEINRGAVSETCNQLRRTWASWYNGSIHARAGRDYCSTFERVINKLDHPDVQKICFGTTDREGKEVRSLKNKVVEFDVARPNADKVIARMRSLNCKDSEPMSLELMGLPL